MRKEKDPEKNGKIGEDSRKQQKEEHICGIVEIPGEIKRNAAFCPTLTDHLPKSSPPNLIQRALSVLIP